MVKNAASPPPAVIADEIDTALQKAIGRTLNAWGRRRGLPPLRWTVEHWDGYVTLVGRPSRRAAKKTFRTLRWTSRLDLEMVDDRQRLWNVTTDGWHVQIQG